MGKKHFFSVFMRHARLVPKRTRLAPLASHLDAQRIGYLSLGTKTTGLGLGKDQ